MDKKIKGGQLWESKDQGTKYYVIFNEIVTRPDGTQEVVVIDDIVGDIKYINVDELYMLIEDNLTLDDLHYKMPLRVVDDVEKSPTI